MFSEIEDLLGGCQSGSAWGNRDAKRRVKHDMLQHKHPGKSSLTAGAAPAQDHPTPGKQTRVEQAHGPTASAAVLDGGGPAVSTTSSDTVTFNEGMVKVTETISLTLTHGSGDVSVDLHKGGIQVGNDHMSIDVKSPDAATGKGLHLGGSTTVTKGHTRKVEGKVEHDEVGAEYTTTWEVEGKGWKATVLATAFMGIKRPPPPKHHGVVHNVIHAVEHGVSAIAHEILKGQKALIHSAPKWGPYVVAALIAVAAAGQEVVVG